MNVYARINTSTTANILQELAHVPCAARAQRLRPRRRHRLLLEALRHHAGQGAARLCQLRHRRAAAEARPHRGRRRWRFAEPPRRRGRVDRRRDVDDRTACRRRPATATEDEVACCYAVQDKVWVDAPDGEPWEIYTVLADVEMAPGQLRTVAPDSDASAADDLCCAAAPESEARCCG